MKPCMVWIAIAMDFIVGAFMLGFSTPIGFYMIAIAFITTIIHGAYTLYVVHRNRRDHEKITQARREIVQKGTASCGDPRRDAEQAMKAGWH